MVAQRLRIALRDHAARVAVEHHHAVRDAKDVPEINRADVAMLVRDGYLASERPAVVALSAARPANPPPAE